MKYILAIPVLFIFVALIILYDGFMFMHIWNLLMPPLFPMLPKLTLISSMAINVVITYQKISSIKRTGKVDYTGMILSPILILIVAWIIAQFI